MVSKQTHPDTQLFEYLNGSLDEPTGAEISQHIRECAECRSVAGLVRALKSQIPDLESQTSDSHPDVSLLARLFYGERDPKTAAHVAACRSCVGELAEYSRVERIASEYDRAQTPPAKTPARAWEMIRDWEETLFAGVKPEIERLSQEMLVKLARLVSEKKEHLREMEHRAIEKPEDAGQAEMVPVVVVDNQGRLRGVELFESITGPHGENILKHSKGSDRFDSKPFHALLDYGETSPLVISNRVRRDRVELSRPARSSAAPSRADYFIIED